MRLSLYHRPCGNLAGYTPRYWWYSIVLTWRDVMRLDGTYWPEGEHPTCATCGGELFPSQDTYPREYDQLHPALDIRNESVVTGRGEHWLVERELHLAHLRRGVRWDGVV
jgi:hypothetical protein